MTTYLWTTVPSWVFDGEEELVLLDEETANFWRVRVEVLSCLTWGEVRALGTEIYEEVLGLAGYSTFDEYVSNLQIPGSVPGLAVPPQAIEEFAQHSEDGPPNDDVSFFAEDDLPACADRDWPPLVEILVHDSLPGSIIYEYASVTSTTFNGDKASIPARHKRKVFADLRADGHSTKKADWLAELFVWSDLIY